MPSSSTRCAVADVQAPWTIGSPSPTSRAIRTDRWIGLWSPEMAAKASMLSGARSEVRATVRRRAGRDLAAPWSSSTDGERVGRNDGVADQERRLEPADQVARGDIGDDGLGVDATTSVVLGQGRDLGGDADPGRGPSGLGGVNRSPRRRSTRCGARGAPGRAVHRRARVRPGWRTRPATPRRGIRREARTRRRIRPGWRAPRSGPGRCRPRR